MYALDLTTGAKTVVYSFKGGADGESPHGGLISAGGLLYGTTSYGGGASRCDYGCGSVFSLDPATGAETIVYTFKGGSDGAIPNTDLIMVDGLLYGVTLEGGLAKACRGFGCGTVFSLDPASGAETVLHTFREGADGGIPDSDLILVNGALYGTASFGGNVSDDCPEGCGTLFSVDLASSKVTQVYAFKGGSDGDMPRAGLVEVGGTLYGTTEIGGGGASPCDYGCGSVFSLNPKTGAETLDYAFGNGDDGLFPVSGLIKVGGLLYGTTAGYGRSKGTVFSFDPATGVESVLHRFKGVGDGRSPGAGLTYFDHRLYGTTVEGGSANCRRGCGTIFSIRP